MKLSDSRQALKIFDPAVLLCVLPCALIIPNIVLDITDYSNWLEKIANVMLPFGVYLWLLGLSRNTGRTALLMFPFIFYAAFQVVLLYLYGESIIAVDMFLNVVTTNVGEATELLGNLSLAIMTVIVLYLVPVIWSIVLVCRGQTAPSSVTAVARKYGIISFLIGLGAMIAAYIFLPTFSFFRDVFPANVINNTITAAIRTEKTRKYPETSAGFNFHASSTRADSLPEVYVVVIGETSRADNWQLFGYGRSTNPRLSQRDSLLVFDKALSQSNTTHKSVPLLLTSTNPATFNDSIYRTKSFITAFRQAGYSTAFFSNQARNHSFIDFFAEEADSTCFIRDDGHHHKDLELVPMLRDFITSHGGCKVLVVLHTYGSHFNYKDRFDHGHAVFGPYEKAAAKPDNRAELVNAYDNTIVMTDAVLDQVITILEQLQCPSAMLYLSDHGEDIFDDRRERFLHSSPVPTYYQIHVPLLLWISPQLDAYDPSLYRNAAIERHSNIASNDIVFHTIMNLAGITSIYNDSTRSVVSPYYLDRPRVYLNDYNESIPLKHSGLRDYDFEQLDKNHISYE